MTKLDLLKNWYDSVWVKGDISAIDQFFAPMAGANGLMPDGQVGAEDFRALVPALRALVRNLSIGIDHFQEGGDWLWAQVTVNALPAQGVTPIKASGQVMLRFDGGKITEAYNMFDFLTFFEQAGLLPKDTFLLLLAGETLG
jgi:hypothetical protein